MKTTNEKTSLGITYQSILLALGLYFFCRIFRNNLYFLLIGPLEESRPVLYEGLRYLGHLIMLCGLFLYFALVPEECHCLQSARFSRKEKSGLWLVLGLLFGFLMNAASVVIALIHGDIDMAAHNFNPFMLVFLFICVFVQSSTEEFHYRLWTHNRIISKTTLDYAVIGSALAFAFSHMLNNGISFVAVVNLTLIGVLYSLSLHYFGNIWFACGHHAAWNFTQNCIFGLPNSGTPAVITVMAPTYTKTSFFYDAVFGVEGTWITVFINVIAIGVFLVLIRKKPVKNHPEEYAK